jgi:hypothetical protein
MDLSIIIVSWNVKDKLRENLLALQSSIFPGKKMEIFVVDNASADGSAAMVAAEFPQIRLIANQENLGFSKANNQAIELATGRFILLLNPDMRVYPDTLDKALSWAENNPQATVSGCHLVDEKGLDIKQVRRFPGFFDQLAVVLKLPHIFPGITSSYLLPNFDYSQAASVDSIRGAFFLINTVSWKKISSKKPFLDERYFIWFEEVDFCRQVYQLGGEVWYSPAANCLDYVGASFKQIKRRRGQDYFSDSMLKYFAKWEKAWQVRCLAIAWRFIKIFV